MRTILPVQCILLLVLSSCDFRSTIKLSRAATSADRRPSLLTKKSTGQEVLNELIDSNNITQFKNQKNIVAVVTGGSNGIGLSTVQTLSQYDGMNVVMCARNTKIAKEKIKKNTIAHKKKNKIRIQELDLSDLVSIKKACKEIIKREGHVDILINNAGVMALPNREETKQGFEMQIGVNHIGHFLFTRLLLPIMNDGGRIVTVSSRAHSKGTIDIDDLNYNKGKVYSSWGSYRQSKLANILFAKALQDHLNKKVSTKKNILSVSVHPGVIKTTLWKHFPTLFQFIGGILFADKTIEQGAATTIYASLIDSNMLHGGEYLVDCNITAPSIIAQDNKGEMRNILWDETEKMIRNTGFSMPPI